MIFPSRSESNINKADELQPAFQWDISGNVGSGFLVRWVLEQSGRYHRADSNEVERASNGLWGWYRHRKFHSRGCVLVSRQSIGCFDGASHAQEVAPFAVRLPLLKHHLSSSSRRLLHYRPKDMTDCPGKICCSDRASRSIYR